MKLLLNTIVIISIVVFSNCERRPPIGMDYAIFYGTPVNKLAQAVKKTDLDKASRILKSKPELVNMRDPYYGSTILMVAVMNNNIDMVKLLLENGANPNQYEDSIHHAGDNALLVACSFPSVSNEILDLLLEYGGDPNSYSKGIQYYNQEYIPIRRSALEYASRSTNPDKVKNLISHDADINNNGTYPFDHNPLDYAITENLDIAFYLLSKGADYNKKFPTYRYDSITDEYVTDSIDICQKLRKVIPYIDTSEYLYKQMIIAFLKSKGVDYYSAPIPESIVEKIKRRYPDTWQDYLENY